MSTPPHLRLPAGAVLERWPGRAGSLAVLHSGLVDGVPGADRAQAWAVLVPGFTGSKEDFIALPPLLATGGVGMLTYDQIGQHESDGSAQASDYALPRLAEDLADVIAQAAERLGRADPPHLVGHSFGGLVAQQAVASGVVRPASLVLLCTGPGALPPHRHGPLPTLVQSLPHTSLATLWEMKRALDESEAAEHGEEIVHLPEVDAFLERRWLRNHPVQLQQFGRLLLEQPPHTSPLRERVSGGDAGDPIPTAVIWGEYDDAWPIELQQQLALDLGARAFEIPGAGHSPNADSPDALVAALLHSWA